MREKIKQFENTSKKIINILNKQIKLRENFIKKIEKRLSKRKNYAR